MSTAETWMWIVFIMAAVIAVHPAIDIVADAKWKLDNRIVWAQSQKSSVWQPLHYIFDSSTSKIAVHSSYSAEFRNARMKAWADVFHGRITTLEAIKQVEQWAEGRK